MNIDLLISLTLALIMFGIGASLKIADFKATLQKPKALSLGLLLQLVFLPCLAFLIAIVSDLSPVWKVGLFVVSICPGGTSSNFISYLAKTDVALSISLTTINSFIILLTIPMLTNWSLGYFGLEYDDFSLNVLDTAIQVFWIILLPVFMGVIFNERFSKTSNKIKNPLKYINIILLGIVFAIKFFASESQGGSGLNMEAILALLPACIGIHLIAMLGSYFIASGFKFNPQQAITIGIEVGLQNTTLALLVTATFLNNNEMSEPALVFAMFSFFTTLIFALFVTNKKNFIGYFRRS